MLLAMSDSTRRLSDVARHVVIPSGIVSTGWPAVYERIREFGDEFDTWQQGWGSVVLGKRDNGDYAATVGGVVMSIPRQVAKTYMVGRLAVALCTLFPGLQVLWTAHRGATATRAFESMHSLCRRKSVAKHVSRIRVANGEQSITFKNGARIAFGAREQGFGRGFENIDIEVFDEAQILSERALEDMVAAMNQSKHPHGALIFYMGTPPRPIDPGEQFAALRRDALEVEKMLESGEPSESESMYVECSADRDADPDDRQQWRKANPSYPVRTPQRSMLRLRKNLVSDGAWRREALGIWDDDSGGSRAVSSALWDAAAIDEPPAGGARSYGVAFSADGMRVALAGALRHDDGVHVELIDAFGGSIEAGLAPLADWLAERRDRGASFVLSGRAGAGVLAQLLSERRLRGRRVVLPTTPQYFQACGMFLDSVNDGTVTHLKSAGQSRLDDSVAVCDKRFRGKDGAWGWESTIADGDETPVEAVSLALWGVRTSTRNSSGPRVVVV